MLKYFGKEYGYKTLVDYTGDFSQLAGIKRYAFTCGKSKGVEAVDIRTGSGLGYTVLLDRALDIAWAEYKSIPLAYMSPAGIVSPPYYNPEGNEWLRSFGGGLMTTCGLSNVGAASEWDGMKYGQHGQLSNLPGEQILIEEGFDGSEYVISVKGHVKQVKPFLEDMRLHRTIRSVAGKDKITIADTIENKGISRQPFMLLYHFNFGFPLVNEHSEIFVPDSNCFGINEEKDLNQFKKPNDPFEEQVFFLETNPNQDGTACFMLINDRKNPDLALKITYSYHPLNKLMVWKYLNAGNYVLCIEPANCCCKGIAYEHERGSLKYLDPLEKREIIVEMEVLVGTDEINGEKNVCRK